MLYSASSTASFGFPFVASAACFFAAPAATNARFAVSTTGFWASTAFWAA